MLQGRQTWVFESKPVIVGNAAVGGPFESNCALADDFDMFTEDLWLGQDSYEKAERKLLEHACEIAIKKSGIKKRMLNFFSGDLINQIISSSFAARTLEIPYLGIYGACSSSMEGLALASLLVDTKFAKMPWRLPLAIMRHVKSSIDILQSMEHKNPYCTVDSYRCWSSYSCTGRRRTKSCMRYYWACCGYGSF